MGLLAFSLQPCRPVYGVLIETFHYVEGWGDGLGSSVFRLYPITFCQPISTTPAGEVTICTDAPRVPLFYLPDTTIDLTQQVQLSVAFFVATRRPAALPDLSANCLIGTLHKRLQPLRERDDPLKRAVQTLQQQLKDFLSRGCCEGQASVTLDPPQPPPLFRNRSGWIPFSSS